MGSEEMTEPENSQNEDYGGLQLPPAVPQVESGDKPKGLGIHFGF